MIVKGAITISTKVDIIRFSLCKFVTYIYSLIMDIEHNLKNNTYNVFE
ncbi:hypothetical protein BTB_c23530 [Bacillus thuringiensis Bt407]|uniref:Uncharacterized protein n=1 Tax=Bacillus thuringiensis T01-328 TaxID=1324966 RepID=A0AAN4HLK0_BACTU|nr:hypothetical protein BTB_c23530 [Bacillus thuringiensis Bt407]AGG00983.1 hypothetical protein H175_ch2270 [Bacillus thuringiensis serovar thuringiensis str. IS5056]EEM66211.1 hypothetical protein bthur0008_21330 [Bacillus thuringiensis serovar berliner ATCC 10792]ERI01847.1 hypothetical protein BTCBT_002111 [Bacillus thuringiensis T01-328]